MPRHAVCATCRLRALITHQSRIRQGRRWLSARSAVRQDERAGEYVDTLFEKLDRSLKQPALPLRQGASQSVARGRYSRQPVPEQSRRPHSQELLDHLAAPHRRPRASKPVDDDHRQQASMVSREETEAPSEHSQRSGNDLAFEPRLAKRLRTVLPAATFEAAGDFIQNNRRKDDRRMWQNLQDVVRECHHPETLEVLGAIRSFNKRFFYWAMRTTDAFVGQAQHNVSNAGDQLSPTPAILLKIRSAMTNDGSTLWPYTLWRLADHVAALWAAKDDRPQTALHRGLEELMAVWALCMKEQQRRGKRPAQKYVGETILSRPTTDFSFLPDAVAFQASLQNRDTFYTLPEMLDYFVIPLAITSNQRDFDYVSAALVTLDLLCRPELPIDPSYEPWKVLMEAVVKSVIDKGVPTALARAAAASENEKVRSYYESVIERFELRKARPSSGESTAQEHNPDRIEGQRNPLLRSLQSPPALTEHSSETDRSVSGWAKALGRALESNKVPHAKRTWQDVKDYSAKYPSIQLPLLLYERLIVTFLALRDQQAVIEIWRAMAAADHRPTVKTYSIVMQGCNHTGDARTLEAFWSIMRKTGVQPDSHAWSTRIFGLLKSRDLDSGMRALSEMGKEWIAAAKEAHPRQSPPQSSKKSKDVPQITPSELVQRYHDDIAGVPRPDQVVMNSAISALAMVEDRQITKVLGWARSFGIEPDLTTYNALLNVAMRHNQAEEALKILRRMDQSGIQADSTTWTVLLTAMFEGGFLDDLDPAAQQERIVGFIDSLEASNAADMDVKGYGLIVARLLQTYNNPSAADAVLQHMSSRKIKPSAHIHTILMTSHFAHPSGTPDFAAIEGLWDTIRTADHGYAAPLDSQFYDRMVEGYATHHAAAGSTRPMLHFLQRMQNEGRKPSWKALTCVVNALAERGEWERARSIVGKVRREVVESRAERQRFGQRDFWMLVNELGLLEETDAPKPNGQRNARGRRQVRGSEV